MKTYEPFETEDSREDDLKDLQKESSGEARGCAACGGSCAETAGEGEFPEQEIPTEGQWREALELTVKQRDEYLNIAQRTQADFQNYKRRTAQTRTEAYDDGVRETMAALLPALDNFDRALNAPKSDYDTLAEGLRMTQRLMLEALAKMGFEEVPALGEKFDPELHDAVMRAEGGEPGEVLEVFEKGYRVKGKIIRYSMVKVCVE